MNLALAWLWKEWLCQWRLLGAYLLMTTASIAIICWGMPAEHWLEQGTGAAALAWFVVVGVAGVVLFAAPQLARGEFQPRDDQFVRRLPGALAPAAAGKLSFLVLATLGLPLLALLLGELAMAALGLPWRDLFRVIGDGEVEALWPIAGVLAVAALPLAVWVAAVGTWLPGGRMAVGGAVLLFLVPGIGVFLLLRACPGLERTIAWQPWLWWLWPAGVVVFAASWRGRRGGGARRSARAGLAACGAVAVVPGVWFGGELWRYRHPDPQHLAFHAYGVAPSGNRVLVHGAGHEEWLGATFCIDVATGRCEQWSNVGDTLVPATLRSLAPTDLDRMPRRWWRSYGHDGGDEVVDLETGERWPCAALPHGNERELRRSRGAAIGRNAYVPEALRAAITGEVRAHSTYRLPDGRRAYCDADDLVIEQPDGGERRVPWPFAGANWFARAHGHAIGGWQSSTPEWFDLATERLVRMPQRVDDAWLVRDRWLVAAPRAQWHFFAPTSGELTPCAELAGAYCLGPVDDDRLLFRRPRGRDLPVEWFAWRPADGRSEAIVLPQGRFVVSVALERDPDGRRWLECASTEVAFVALDPATLATTPLPIAAGHLFAVRGDEAFTQEGACIVRTNWRTGARTVIYPIAARR